MPTFGYTTIGADAASGANPVGSKFTAPEAGTITSMQVYIVTGGSTARAAIYADSSGSPAAKLAESSEVSTTTAAWNDFPISLAMTGSVVYWLVCWVNGSDIRYTGPGDVSNQSFYMTGNTYPTWPDPLNEDAFLDFKVSIYATYTAGGGPTLTLVGRSVLDYGAD